MGQQLWRGPPLLPFFENLAAGQRLFPPPPLAPAAEADLLGQKQIVEAWDSAVEGFSKGSPPAATLPSGLRTP